MLADAAALWQPGMTSARAACICIASARNYRWILLLLIFILEVYVAAIIVLGARTLCYVLMLNRYTQHL